VENSMNNVEKFLKKESINYEIEADMTTIIFRAYGEHYTIRCEKSFVFMCKRYTDINLLILAIEKQCKGYDGKY